MWLICLIILLLWSSSDKRSAAKRARESKIKWDEDNKKYGYTFWTGEDGK